MNILYFIYSNGNASGGHYHSLDQISKEVGKGNSVGIITIGNNISPVLSGNRFFLKHITINNKIKNILYLNNILKYLIAEFNPNVLHCFDTDALNSLILLPATYKYPIILNKCGGPNPTRENYQHADGLILFSAENYNWFKNNRNYKNESINLISNRVAELQYSSDNNKTEPKDSNKINFVRITRIGGAYEKTLMDSYRMIEDLKPDYPVQLIVIGRIQDQARYQWFVEEAKERKLPVSFITDERTNKGADFLYLADFVIGTGRSFMEAISLGIPTLTPAMDADWPVLVNKANFDNFYKTNFSERNKAEQLNLSTNKNEIIYLIKNKTAYKEAQESAIFLFRQYFGTDQILEKYNSLYSHIVSRPFNRVRLVLKNLPYLYKYYFQ